MDDLLKSSCAAHGLTAVTVSHNLRTTYAFSAYAHLPNGGCGHGNGETIKDAIEAAVADARQRFPEAA